MAIKEQTINSAGTRAQGEAADKAVGGGNRLAVGLSLFALYVIWGSTYLAIRIGVQTFPPFLMAGIRFVVAGAGLFLFLRLRGHAAPTRAQWRGAGLVGLLLLVGGNGSVSFAEQWVASGLAALVIATTPLWAALFSGLFGRWPVRLEWIGLALGFAGVALLSLSGNLQANPWGIVAVFIAPISWAFGSIWSKRLPLPPGLMSSAAEMLVAGLIFLVLSPAVGERLQAAPSSASVAALLYLIVFGSLIAYSAYVYLLSHVRASLATSYAYVNPIVAMGLGAAFASEPLTWTGVVAMLVILTGVGVLSLVRGGA